MREGGRGRGNGTICYLDDLCRHMLQLHSSSILKFHCSISSMPSSDAAELTFDWLAHSMMFTVVKPQHITALHSSQTLVANLAH